MAGVDAMRTAMTRVDRTEVYQALPLDQDIEREIVAMEVCVRELGGLSREQRDRVINWVCAVLEKRSTGAPNTVQLPPQKALRG